MEEEAASVPVEKLEEDYGYQQSERSDGGGTRRVSRRTNNVTAEAAPFDITFRPNRMLLYSPPRQRQKWGDAQILPRVNWGDIFFDLFYVAATYNVSAIVVASPTKEGLLYAAGTFLPVMGIWVQKAFYDARYVTEADIFHRFVNVVVTVILAVAILHILPVDILSNAAEKPGMLVFSLMLIVERLLATLLFLEIYFKGVGQSQMKAASLRDIQVQCFCLPFYIAAFTVAAVEFYGDGGAGGRLLAESAEASTYAAVSTNRTSVPIGLCLFGYVGGSLFHTMNIIFCFPGGGRHKEMAVPINIDFIIHRSGEWIMLMLGETIFSILIVDVDVEGDSFFTVFYCGILTAVFLQILHFKSQPHDANSHALRRDKNAGILWNLMHQVYSFALTVLGAAYTFFLLSSDEASEARRLGFQERQLAGVDVSDTAEQAAHLFAGTLAVVFFSLDCMTLLHVGIDDSNDRCALKSSEKNYNGIAVVIVRIVLLAFTATLSQWETNPKVLSLLGLFCTVCQLILRKLGKIFLPPDYSKPGKAIEHGGLDDSETGDANWPNVTHARAEPAKKGDATTEPENKS